MRGGRNRWIWEYVAHGYVVRLEDWTKQVAFVAPNTLVNDCAFDGLVEWMNIDRRKAHKQSRPAKAE